MIGKGIAIVASFLGLALGFVPAAADPGAPPGPTAKFCAGCHQPMPSVMLGFLDSISDKARALQMDFGGSKEIVRYTDATLLRNVDGFDALPRYRGKGFRVSFDDVDGQKVATEIVRFDILATITDAEKLTRSQLKQAMQRPGVALFDVRPGKMYQAAHIPGAKSLPAPAFAKLQDRLPADKATPVILYGPGGCLSPTTSLRVKALGYSDVKIYTSGFGDWSRHEPAVTSADWLAAAVAQAPQSVVIIDVRAEVEAAAGHIDGAVNLPLDRLAASRSLLPEQKNAPIVIYGDDKAAAARQLLDWGYHAVRLLPEGFAEWQQAGHAVATGPATRQIVYRPRPRPGSIGVDTLADMAKAPRDDILLVDLRNPDEIKAPSVDHAANIPLDRLGAELATLPAGQMPVFYCPTGARAEMAYTLATKAGRECRYVDAGVTIDQAGRVLVAAQ
jgi:rhodanese-related sulfurtransferase